MNTDPVNVRRITTNFSAQREDSILLVDASSGNLTGRLFALQGWPQTLVVIQTGATTNTVTLLSPSGSTIYTLSGQNASVTLKQDDIGTWRAVGVASGVKVYRALLTQTGTAAPTATVLENSLGGTVVWTRQNVGVYLATLTGAFTVNKTWFNYDTWQQMDLDGNSTTIFQLQRSSANIMVLTAVTSFADDAPVELGAVINVEILVHP